MAISSLEKHKQEIVSFVFERDYVDFILLEMDRFDQPMTKTLLSFLQRRYGDDYWFCVDISGDQRIDAHVIAGPEKDKDNLNVVHIYSIAVRRQFEGQGWAKKLMLEVINKAKKKQVDAIVLEVRDNNDRALQFYLHLGFIVTGEIKEYYTEEIDAITMRLDL